MACFCAPAGVESQRGLQRFDEGQDVGGVFFDFDARVDFGDPALAVNHEGRSRDAPVFPPVIHLLLPDTIRGGDSVVRVGQKREGQRVLFGEVSMGGDIVRADA